MQCFFSGADSQIRDVAAFNQHKPTESGWLARSVSKCHKVRKSLNIAAFILARAVALRIS